MICFFKQKTAYDVRMSDWSSDVCSSELGSTPDIFDLELQDLQMTAVGGTGVVFNPDGGWIAWPDHEEDLSDAGALQVQQPGTDTGVVALAGPSGLVQVQLRSEEHTSELQSLMRISYAVFCLKKKTQKYKQHSTSTINE